MLSRMQIAVGAVSIVLLSLVMAQRWKPTTLSQAAPNAAEGPCIRLYQSSGEAPTIEVIGLNPHGLEKLQQSHLDLTEWTAIFAVYPGSNVLTDAPAMLGAYEVGGDVIRFRPRFPLVAGLTYTARLNQQVFQEKFNAAQSQESSSLPLIETTLILPKAASASTAVTHVYPSASELPANQLKFYLHFSAPMSVGEAYERIHLLDETGRPVERAFLRVDQELWDASRQRLTLLLDPGRIKRGLRSNVEDGAPLKAGHRYRLVIERGWHDGEGQPLRETFEKAFTAIAPDRTPPDPQKWTFPAPPADTTSPLRLTFPEPLDHALLEQMIEVLDESGRRVAGQVEIASGETQWLFKPQAPWRAGQYSLRVDLRLEDRAGNNLHQPFDVDLQQPHTERAAPSPIYLRFVVLPPANQL